MKLFSNRYYRNTTITQLPTLLKNTYYINCYLVTVDVSSVVKFGLFHFTVTIPKKSPCTPKNSKCLSKELIIIAYSIKIYLF